MASIVPVKPIDKVQFYEDHNAPWTTNAVAIGTTAAAVTALQTKTAAARSAWDAHQVAQGNAKAATEAFHNAVNAMATAGAAIIKQIRAKAEDTANPAVYTLAVIPAPANPSPRPAPGTPEALKVVLKPNGSLELTWKCNNPVGTSGTIYHVYRRDGMAGEFTFIGGTGKKEFADATIPRGSSTVTYSIQAVRSTAIGDAAEFIVNFGVTTGGEITASVVQNTPAPKLAA